ncbi:MAG: peptidoglycan DD-metalloendopeptidase family protein [Oscillospiraceae bacterium]|jgi:murein DD-endopeptidase MepM/ murein hydrolase activator NlpD|nr:peptidoglycan DD-metalloendopeptidase family protein [Oscillospiraceae bacterium]
MKKKHPILDFFTGKGFYVILAMCVVSVGLSGLVLLSGGPDDASGDAADGRPTDLDLGGAPLDWDIPAPVISWETTPPTPAAPRETGRPAPVGGTNDDALAVGGTAIVPPSQRPAAETTPEPSDDAAEPTPTAAPTPKAPVYVWPAAGAVITRHSEDALVYNKTLGDWRTHSGIDIATAAAAKVTAICDGTVEDIYEDSLLGTVVVVSHGRDMRSLYANLAPTPAVNKGQALKAGDTIGAVGESAAAEISETFHLHLEIHQGDAHLDPLTVLPPR